MKHSNISIFIPHVGCPHQCSFCDQRTISGAQHLPDGDEVRAVCEKALAEVRSPEDTEIAFFGGSFTAIPRDYMTELLDAAKDFVGAGKFRGIRCSTRPDCIDFDVLGILARSGVTAIELGAQSMSGRVLEMNERGHSAEDVENAAAMIKQWGFELGLQMMIGLYGSTREDELLTMQKIAEIRPDTVRIYPTVILRGTRLAELLESGEYVPMSFDEVVDIAASGLVMFEGSGIRVIKCGLHASEFVERDMVGGFYHPAFRELCEGMIYRYNMSFQIEQSAGGDRFVFAVAPSCISKAVGQKKSNIEFFARRGIHIQVIGDGSVPKYQCELRR
ncbi:MAG: radical SAM protein [Ruminococcus sp.]|nr:radical SAM protein [Ruminococcus sp.]